MAGGKQLSPNLKYRGQVGPTDRQTALQLTYLYISLRAEILPYVESHLCSCGYVCRWQSLWKTTSL